MVLLEVPTLAFCQIVVHSFRILRERDVTDFPAAYENYQHLKGSVGAINSLFAWLLLFYKGNTLLMVCAYVFVIVNYHTSLADISIYVAVAAYTMAQLSALLVSMGAVRTESEPFKEGWMTTGGDRRRKALRGNREAT